MVSAVLSKRQKNIILSNLLCRSPGRGVFNLGPKFKVKTMKNQKVGKGKSRGNYGYAMNRMPTIENWICPVCRVINNGYRKRCRDCGVKRPKEYLLEQFKTQRE